MDINVFILITLLFILINLFADIVFVESQEEIFFNKMIWHGIVIYAGDYLEIFTFSGQEKGFFRGSIIEGNSWILRISSEDNPRKEINWYEIIDIKKIQNC